MVYLTRRECFCASHRLHNPQLSEEENKALFDKCNNQYGHGHNYILYVTLRGVPDNNGLIINLVDLKLLMHELIISKVDHRHFNHDAEGFTDIMPTVENLVVRMWDILYEKLGSLLYEVKLEETENNTAIYRGEDS